MDRIKNDITNPEFWKRAGIRALKTFCQTMLATGAGAVFIEDVNWLMALSASALAAFFSLLTSIITGLPEV